MTEIFSLDQINKNVLNLYTQNLKVILDNISATYNINKTDLYNKYITTDMLSSGLTKKRKKQKISSNKVLCMARKQDGNQCTRRPKESSEYCGKHIKNRKFGRADNNNDNLVHKLADDDNYVMTWIEQFNGKEYLVDNNNIVYTNDINSPVIVGKKLGDNQLEFIQNTSEMLTL